MRKVEKLLNQIEQDLVKVYRRNKMGVVGKAKLGLITTLVDVLNKKYEGEIK